jgi:hypothetical protein
LENKGEKQSFWKKQQEMETDLRKKRDTALLGERVRREEEQREHIKRLEQQRARGRNHKRENSTNGRAAARSGRQAAARSGIHKSSDRAYVLASLHGATPSEILDVHPAATDETIKKAYRKLALQYHPDRNETADEHLSAEIFKLVSGAYTTLVR